MNRNYIEALYGVYWAITHDFVLTVLILHSEGGSSKIVLAVSYLNGPFQFGARTVKSGG